MQTTRNHQNEPRRVRIVVRGRLSSRIVDGFEGMAARHARGCTELIGDVADQPRLHGLLHRVRDLGLELIELTLLPTESSVSEPGGGSPCQL